MIGDRSSDEYIDCRADTSDRPAQRELSGRFSDAPSSRIPGFYRLPMVQRRATLLDSRHCSEEARQHLEAGGGLAGEIADRLSENVIGCHGLPLSVALNFRVNRRDVVVPMAIEEPSVVAAASNAALLVRATGGFYGEAMAPIMTTQIQLDDVPDPEAAAGRILARYDALLRLGDDAIPHMVARGGGCRDLTVRVLDLETGLVVVHIDVNVGNPMGANLVDEVAEAVAPTIHELAGGRLGLRILTNLPLRRLVQVRARVTLEALGGLELADGIARASRFAERDPFRAVTHNKGILNGIDAAAVALGQDWRSIEAGAHCFASLSGVYRPLATWRLDAASLQGQIELPMAVGTVGGVSRAHPGVRAALELLGARDAGELGIIMAAVGLASNLAALKALAGEGIQRGHMKLHRRKLELMNGASEDSGS